MRETRLRQRYTAMPGAFDAIRIHPALPASATDVAACWRISLSIWVFLTLLALAGACLRNELLEKTET